MEYFYPWTINTWLAELQTNMQMLEVSSPGYNL